MDLTPFLREAAREGDVDEQIRREDRRAVASEDWADEEDDRSRHPGNQPDESQDEEAPEPAGK